MTELFNVNNFDLLLQISASELHACHVDGHILAVSQENRAFAGPHNQCAVLALVYHHLHNLV